MSMEKRINLVEEYTVFHIETGINLAKEYYNFHIRIFKRFKEHERAGNLNEKQKKLMLEFEEKLSEIKNVIESGDDVKCLIMVFDNHEPWRSQWIKRFKESEEQEQMSG